MEKSHRYILLSNNTGERLELQQAPIGFDSTKFNLIRDLLYLGILKKISVEFSFVGDGFDFCQRHRLLFGVDSDIIIRRYTNNPNRFEFEGKLNQQNYNEDRKFHKYSCDIIQSSFVQKFHNREDVKLNVLNNISMDRKPIAPAGLVNATIRGKQIEFYSEFNGVSTEQPEIYHHILPALIGPNGNTQAVKGVYASLSGDPNLDPAFLVSTLYTKENSFYVNTLPDTQTIDLAFEIDLTRIYAGTAAIPRFGDLEPLTIYKMLLLDADDNVVDTLFERRYLNAFGNFVETFSDSIDVDPGYSIVLVCEHYTKLISSGTEDQLDFFDNNTETTWRVETTYNALRMTITQASVLADSVHPVLLPHELFSNLIAQINGGRFYSEVFGREELGYVVDGEFAYLAITTGELLRGVSVEEVQIATSMREAFASYSSVICLGAIITEDQIRIDPLEVLFNANIAASIGEVSELNIVPAKEFLFNSTKCGFPIFDYEQENGRDEVNTEYQFTNSLQAVKKELDLVSKYYAGSYFVEFARRLSVINTGTADTKYDGKICFVDLIKITEGDTPGELDAELDVDLGVLSGTLQSRRLEGILFVDGIFSPETAINLRIAPGQNMLRWKKYLNVPLDKKDKVYYFQSKDKNASLNLVTELGETIDGQDLDTGGATLFKPEERQFKCPITIDLLFAILANPLGIVHYTYEGEKFFDYLFEVDAETDKGTAVWRMLGTKDSPVQTLEDVDDDDILMWGEDLEDVFDHGSGELLYQ